MIAIFSDITKNIIDVQSQFSFTRFDICWAWLPEVPQMRMYSKLRKSKSNGQVNCTEKKAKEVNMGAIYLFFGMALKWSGYWTIFVVFCVALVVVFICLCVFFFYVGLFKWIFHKKLRWWKWSGFQLNSESGRGSAIAGLEIVNK